MMIKVNAFSFTSAVLFLVRKFLQNNPAANKLSSAGLMLAFMRSTQGDAVRYLWDSIKIDEELHNILEEPKKTEK